MNQLADVHVVVAVANVGPDRLDDLADHGDDDVPPGQRQRLAVEQLLQQRHHVAVVGRAAQFKNEILSFNIQCCGFLFKQIKGTDTQKCDFSILFKCLNEIKP